MSPDESVTAFAPATIGNVICGFDTFGLALSSPGDRVTVRRSGSPGLRITAIRGDRGRLPTSAEDNSATIAITALLQGTGRDESLEVEVDKGLPLAGGMGGSAASAVAGVVAADRLLGTSLSGAELLSFASRGEQAAAGGAHLDNVAPALLGGLLLVRPRASTKVVKLPIPDGLSVALLHPGVELSTREGRQAIGDTVALSDAVSQWGNTALFVHALHTRDWDLLSEALEDRIAEPHRKDGIPGFEQVRDAALEAGAIGCGISGAGPAVFALCRNPADAEVIGSAMLQSYSMEGHPPATLHCSPISHEGAYVVSGGGEPG